MDSLSRTMFLDRPRDAWGLQTQNSSLRSIGTTRPYFDHIEHLADVPGQHVPQGMWHHFLLCYGQHGQDFIDTRRHAASSTPHAPPLPLLPPTLVFCAHPILNSGCSVSCIAFCLPRVPSLLESLHFALVVFLLLLPIRVVLCPFQSASFRCVILNFQLQCEKLQGKNRFRQ